MSKNDWYGGYGFVPAKDNYEEMSFKQEMLKRKYIKMCSKNKLNENVDCKRSSNKFTLEELSYKGIKEDTSHIDKINVLKKELSESKKEVLSLKKEITKIKKVRFEYIKKIDSQKDEISSLKDSLEKMERLLEEERTSNRLLKKKLEKSDNSFDKKELRRLNAENQRLACSNSNLSKRLSLANKKIQNYQLIRNGEVDSGAISKYRELLSQKCNEVDNLKKKLCLAHDVVNNLNARIGNKKRNIILRKINEYEKSLTKSTYIIKSELNENVVFGFLSLNKDKNIIFIDINNKRYTISKNNNYEKLMGHIGMPARAIKNENGVFVDYIYYTVTKKSKDKLVSSNKMKITKEQLDVLTGSKDELKGKRILLIGSKRKGYYCSALSRLGASVVYHESFSDNESRLIDVAPSCDVVLVCTSHVSHSIMHEIKNLSDYVQNNVKYQMIEKDNVQNLIHRIRYVLENKK